MLNFVLVTFLAFTVHFLHGKIQQILMYILERLNFVIRPSKTLINQI